MGAYRKKPVVIQAWPIRELLHAAEHDWSALPKPVADEYERGIVVFTSRELFIKTLEGTMTGGIEDILIEGVQGEFYPCKPDIFAATYDENV